MDKLSELDQLIEQVLGVRPRGVEVVMEAGRSQTTALRSSDAIPAVPYPKLQITDQWGKSAEEGFDVQLFQTAGLGQGSDIKERLQRLNTLVDCGSDCPTLVQEIIARLTIMDMWSSMMNDHVESAKGFLFENFIALCLKGTVVQAYEGGSLPIDDVEIMSSDETTLEHAVSLKLLKEGAQITGSFKNLYKKVFGSEEEKGVPITYIIGYKLKSGKAVDLISIVIDETFFNEYLLKKYNEKKGEGNFYLGQWAIGPAKKAGGYLGQIPIYSYKQMKNRAEKLTENLNRPVTEIYESLNLFSRELTEFYLSNDVRNGRKARDTFDRLVSAVNQEEKLK